MFLMHAFTANADTTAGINLDEVDISALTELTDMRTENSKTYDLGNNTEFFTGPIHYRENGLWKDIDTSIMEYTRKTADGNYKYKK